MENETIIMIAIIANGIISFFFATLHRSAVRFKKIITPTKENFRDWIVISVGAAVLKASCCVLWIGVIGVMIEYKMPVNMVSVTLVSAGIGAYLGYLCINWWISKKMKQYGISEKDDIFVK